MGGNAIPGAERLTPAEYREVVDDVLSILRGAGVACEATAPLGFKESHGDVDVVVDDAFRAVFALRPEVTTRSGHVTSVSFGGRRGKVHQVDLIQCASGSSRMALPSVLLPDEKVGFELGQFLL